MRCGAISQGSLGKDMKVRIVPSELHQGKYAVEYKRFFFWRKGFTYYDVHNDESGCTVFSKELAKQKALELYEMLTYKVEKKR